MVSYADYNLILENPEDRLRGLKWVTTEGHHIPGDAIPGGRDESGDTLYIARALRNNCMIPGKAGRHMPGGCSVVYNGTVELVHVYQVLCGHPSLVCWIPLDKSLVTNRRVRLVRGGFEGADELYIGRSDDDPIGQLGLCKLKPGNLLVFGVKDEVRFTFNFKWLMYSFKRNQL